MVIAQRTGQADRLNRPKGAAPSRTSDDRRTALDKAAGAYPR